MDEAILNSLNFFKNVIQRNNETKKDHMYAL